MTIARVLRNAQHRELYLWGLRLACTPQEPFSLRHSFFLFRQHTNLPHDRCCIIVVEIARNAPVTDLNHTDAPYRKWLSCFKYVYIGATENPLDGAVTVCNVAVDELDIES